MKSCPNCNASVNDTAKFCNKCGFNIKKHEEENSGAIMFCEECGAKMISGSVFCEECGFKIGENTASPSSEGFNFGAISNITSNATEQLYSQNGFTVENGVLVEYTGKKRAVTIPATVEEIFDRAFENNELITSVAIEEGVQVIGKRAFANCSCLAKITIPASCATVFEDAFEGTRLENLILSEVNDDIIKLCLSENAKKHFSSDFITDCILENGNAVVVNIKAIEKKAEEKRKAEEDAKRKAEAEAKRKAEEARRRAEEEERRKAEEAKRKAEEEERRKAEEEAKQKAEAEAKRKAELAKWEVGKNPTFGSYCYSSSGAKKPIEWIVLAREGNKALLISKYVLDKCSYDDSKSITWEKCALRRRLNNEFLNTAFNSREKSKIQTTSLQNPENSQYYTPGGKATNDRIFLLSIDEAKKYFSSNENRRSQSSPYADWLGVTTDDSGYGSWWLRSPGLCEEYAALVGGDGAIDAEGYYVWGRIFGVRPAMWISLD